jgi:hypothetical protein
MVNSRPETARIAQHIMACAFVDLYWEIKRSSDPRVSVTQSLDGVSQANLVQFLIKLTETWYRQQQQLETANDFLDLGK